MRFRLKINTEVIDMEAKAEHFTSDISVLKSGTKIVVEDKGPEVFGLTAYGDAKCVTLALIHIKNLVEEIQEALEERKRGKGPPTLYGVKVASERAEQRDEGESSIPLQLPAKHSGVKDSSFIGKRFGLKGKDAAGSISSGSGASSTSTSSDLLKSTMSVSLSFMSFLMQEDGSRMKALEKMTHCNLKGTLADGKCTLHIKGHFESVQMAQFLIQEMLKREASNAQNPPVNPYAASPMTPSVSTSAPNASVQPPVPQTFPAVQSAAAAHSTTVAVPSVYATGYSAVNAASEAKSMEFLESLFPATKEDSDTGEWKGAQRITKGKLFPLPSHTDRSKRLDNQEWSWNPEGSRQLAVSSASSFSSICNATSTQMSVPSVAPVPPPDPNKVSFVGKSGNQSFTSIAPVPPPDPTKLPLVGKSGNQTYLPVAPVPPPQPIPPPQPVQTSKTSAQISQSLATASSNTKKQNPSVWTQLMSSFLGSKSSGRVPVGPVHPPQPVPSAGRDLAGLVVRNTTPTGDKRTRSRSKSPPSKRNRQTSPSRKTSPSHRDHRHRSRTPPKHSGDFGDNRSKTPPRYRSRRSESPHRYTEEDRRDTKRLPAHLRLPPERHMSSGVSSTSSDKARSEKPVVDSGETGENVTSDLRIGESAEAHHSGRCRSLEPAEGEIQDISSTSEEETPKGEQPAWAKKGIPLHVVVNRCFEEVSVKYEVPESFLVKSISLPLTLSETKTMSEHTKNMLHEESELFIKRIFRQTGNLSYPDYAEGYRTLKAYLELRNNELLKKAIFVYTALKMKADALKQIDRAHWGEVAQYVTHLQLDDGGSKQAPSCIETTSYEESSSSQSCPSDLPVEVINLVQQILQQVLPGCSALDKIVESVTQQLSQIPWKDLSEEELKSTIGSAIAPLVEDAVRSGDVSLLHRFGTSV
ncbi:unnamed protein product [Cyprideis torosa]|uniref:Uncharacterized protein n=1 Tax=Cyprideis torosa TaxID=163714 RepID=A0A7R8W1N9_9CRUS|nr:unnamed protein product [Cyprideis torosa]CAG0879983.1 unnamed protein product [Cyprideis torosa]